MEEKNNKKETKKKKRYYIPRRKNWVKLWTHESLFGTTRFELLENERGIWTDLLCLAGVSKFPGIIAAGKYEEDYKGYPEAYLWGILNVSEETWKSAIEKCERSGKIEIERNGSGEIIITVVNFSMYQSEYQRQLPYRKQKEGLAPESDPREYEERYGHLLNKKGNGDVRD